MKYAQITINSMINMNYFKVLLIAIGVLALSQPVQVQAGDKEWSKEDIMWEISYLCKKLMDMSDEDTLTLNSPKLVKPFIGICTDIEDNSIKITCVTPGTQAHKAGLQTGDIVLRLNELDFQKSNSVDIKHDYYQLIREMQTGDEMEFFLNRNDQQVTVMVTVGSIDHPAYELTINR